MKLPEGPMSKLPSLANVELKVPKVATAQVPINREPYNLPVTFNGTPFMLYVENNSYFEDRMDTLNVIKVSKNTFQDVAGITIQIKKDQDGIYRARVYVENNDRTTQGLGRALWKMSLKFIQKFADERGISITDRSFKMPDHGLTSEKWDELFLGLLNEEGYTKIKPGLWEKIYLPREKLNKSTNTLG